MKADSDHVPVMEIMTREPATVEPGEGVAEAAQVMAERELGSLIVVDAGKPVGIVTERDMAVKVVAKGKAPKSMKVKEIMSSPIVTVPPDEDVLEAAKTMAKRKIRRLAVVDRGKLVGVVTENDILRLWPHLIEVTREFARIGGREALLGGGNSEGYCDACGTFSEDLQTKDSLTLCADCRAW